MGRKCHGQHQHCLVRDWLLVNSRPVEHPDLGNHIHPGNAIAKTNSCGHCHIDGFSRNELESISNRMRVLVRLVSFAAEVVKMAERYPGLNIRLDSAMAETVLCQQWERKRIRGHAYRGKGSENGASRVSKNIRSASGTFTHVLAVKSLGYSIPASSEIFQGRLNSTVGPTAVRFLIEVVRSLNRHIVCCQV